MLVFEGESIPKLYPEILQAILDNGVEVGPRGMKTKELSPVTIISNNPRQRLFGHPTRRDVSIFIYIEGLWILLKERTPFRVTHYVKAMGNYTNEKSGFFDGAYGPAIRQDCGYDQFNECYKRLKEDPDTRQAIIVVNNPVHHRLPTKDYPCTMFFQFLIRRGQLDMIVYMRSQDAWLGLVYDTGEFQWFHEIMAGWLGLDVGIYTHIDGSLHLYEKNWKKAQELIEKDSGWDIYRKASILDSRLPKLEYDKTEKILGLWEEACRTNNFNKVEIPEVENWDCGNDFYNNLLDLILAYNLRLRGKRKQANLIIRHNQSDLGLIYRSRWLK